jgi:hypothetical protein
LESSRCSCSLCSSQGAVCVCPGARGCPPNRTALGATARCYHAAPAGPEENEPRPPRGGPEPFLQNGIVMTDESRLG